MRSAWSCPADSRMNSPWPRIRPSVDRWKLMSVTFDSGIMFTFLVTRPCENSIRCEVITK
jgi:hypothetical protein